MRNVILTTYENGNHNWAHFGNFIALVDEDGIGYDHVECAQEGVFADGKYEGCEFCEGKSFHTGEMIRMIFID